MHVPTLEKIRDQLSGTDPDDHFWDFTIIHYNNKFFGGTRNEFRMTHLSGFFRKWDCSEGDTPNWKDSSGISTGNN